MLGIAYAKRSLKGATRGSESGNLPRRYPSGLVTNYQLMASAARRTVPPLRGYDWVVVLRAASERLGSQLRAPDFLTCY
jgi:hypothetical protein